MKESFNLFGFKINTKKFILTMVIAISVLLLLVGVDILWLDISWYGVFIGLAFILAVVISSELASERGLYKDISYDVIWVVFPLALFGARVFYVITSPHEFSGFIDMLKVWEGGLSIYGGIFFGALGVIGFCLYKKINILKAFDIFAPVLVLGQSIGRWGNFINKEVYGFEITNKSLQWFPFGVNIDGTWHLATFFYESIINLIGFFVLLTILRKTKKPGIVGFTYIAWYGVLRLFLESLRVEEFILYIPGTKIMFSSLLSIIFIVIGVVGLLYILFADKLKARQGKTK